MTDFQTALLRATILAAALAVIPATMAPSPTAAADVTTAAVTNGPDDFIADEPAPTFATPDEAVASLKAAFQADDVAEVARILGLDAAKLMTDQPAMDSFDKIREGMNRRVLVDTEGDTRTVKIGNMLWPLPFPLQKGPAGWAFDTRAGIQEIIDRRVGENEIETIATMNALVSAQEEYHSVDRDGDGVLEYAQRLVSTEGKTDGLFWPDDQGDGVSPIGSMAIDAQLEKARTGKGYFGYNYRILTRQGGNIAGGAYDYVINGNMIGGHALVAWPVKYGQTGIHTFVVNHQGVVYEADLGEDTDAVVAEMRRFNPGDDWTIAGD